MGILNDFVTDILKVLDIRAYFLRMREYDYE